jgi:hypothetical protein
VITKVAPAGTLKEYTLLNPLLGVAPMSPMKLVQIDAGLNDPRYAALCNEAVPPQLFMTSTVMQTLEPEVLVYVWLL